MDKLYLDFFRAYPFIKDFGEHSAKVITAISMFYDLDDPNRFVDDVKKCLTPDGTFIVQQNYLGGMLAQNAVDNICHEHLEYYRLGTMQQLLDRHGMEVYHVNENDLNGGSFRTFIGNKGEHPVDISVYRMAKRENFDYQDFAKRSQDNAQALHDFLEEENQKGKKTYIYGASTRGNTLMQFASLEGMCPKALERNPDKWGRDYNGAKMVSEAEGRADNPDYFLVLPWFFKKEFLEREKEFIDRGGKLIFPLPRLEVCP